MRQARPGAAAITRPDATGLAFPYSLMQVLLPAGGYKSFTKKTTAAAAAADAGVVFYKYGATGINAVEHYQEQARAASGFSRIRWRARAESVYNKLSSLQCAREIISAVFGRRRRTGAASRPRIGGNKIQTSLGTGAKAR